jgi:hypothetical protein
METTEQKVKEKKPKKSKTVETVVEQTPTVSNDVVAAADDMEDVISKIDLSAYVYEDVVAQFDELVEKTSSNYLYVLNFSETSALSNRNENDKLKRAVLKIFRNQTIVGKEAHALRYVFEKTNAMTYDTTTFSYKVDYSVIEAAWYFLLKAVMTGYEAALEYTYITNAYSKCIKERHDYNTKLQELSIILTAFDAREKK